MLAQRYPLEEVRTLLLPRTAWQPYPTIYERQPWEALPIAVRRLYVEKGEAMLGTEWPSLPATLFLQFARNGNRRNYEILHFERRGMLGTLIMAECMEAQGRFLDDIVNGIWAICEESFWGVPAHIGRQTSGKGLPDTREVVVDLFAAETGALLAWASYLLGARLDAIWPLLRDRIAREVDQRILTPCLARDDHSWMGFENTGRRVNNWNPWICSNWLACTLLLEEDVARRQESVFKIMQTVDNFVDPYPQDGGCDEGPSYWGRAGASLFDNLDLFYSATNGQLNLYDEPLIQEIGRFIYRVQIDGDYYINFADAPALVYPDALLVYRYGMRIADPEMVAHGLWLAERQEIQRGGTDEAAEQKSGAMQKRHVPTSLGRLLPTLFTLSGLPTMPAQAPLPRDVWLPEIQVMVARDVAGAAAGLFVAAKGGNNDESHNHNDIGNFVIYADGKPVIVDAGVETYTAKTFGAQRYEIWTMQSAYHSLLPTIDGAQQWPGPNFKATDVAYAVADELAKLTLDIGQAYAPTAQIERWQRTIALQRGQFVQIDDQYVLQQRVGEIVLSVLTPCAVDLSQAGVIQFNERTILRERTSGKGRLTYDGDCFTIFTQPVVITDERLGGTWGESLTQVVLRAESPAMAGQWSFRFTSA